MLLQILNLSLAQDLIGLGRYGVFLEAFEAEGLVDLLQRFVDIGGGIFEGDVDVFHGVSLRGKQAVSAGFGWGLRSLDGLGGG